LIHYKDDVTNEGIISAVQDPPTITIAVYAGIEKLDLRGLTDAAGTTYSKAFQSPLSSCAYHAITLYLTCFHRYHVFIIMSTRNAAVYSMTDY